MKLPALDHVLEYRNPRVLKLYQQNYPANKLPAELAFKEVLKYLWLTQKHQQDKERQPQNDELPARCIMLRSMQEIDQMWHEFILFTEDYTQFCHYYFGGYIHHLPNIFDNSPLQGEESLIEAEKLLPYVYDNLGQETLQIWFASYLELAS